LTDPITLRALKFKPYHENPRTLGERLRKRRLELQMSQVEAGKRLGVKGARFGTWERDDIGPQAEFAAAIRSFFGYDPRSESPFDNDA
jgi:transcriptional regulator with XRE-family HTH domain